jgi:tetratricopeptide (TPR) repeat protein
MRQQSRSSFPGSDRLQDLDLMQALDELVARWRKNPDPESTLALCAHLGTSPELELIHEVASLAETWHKGNHPVMLSVGRMYLDAGLLAEAQAALMQAGRLAPTDAEAYRHLGEVLLRRGDAIRSEKTFARAIQLGDDRADTNLWHERAVLFVALQKRQGLTAVADEVARTVPHQPSIPPPTLSPFARGEDENASGTARSVRRSRPPLAASRSGGRRRSSVAPPGRRRGSTPPPASAAPGGKSAPLDTLLMGGSPRPAPPHGGPPEPLPRRQGTGSRKHEGTPTHRAKAGPGTPASTRSDGRAAKADPAMAPTTSASRRRPPLSELLRDSTNGSAFDPEAAMKTHPDREPPGDPFSGTFSEALGAALAPPVTEGLASAAAPRPSPAPVAAAPAVTALATAAPFPAPVASASPPAPRPAASRPQSLRVMTPAQPHAEPPPLDRHSEAELDPTPEVVLSTLAQVGLYERESPVVPAWEAAPRISPRRLLIAGGALLFAACVGLGGYHYAARQQNERLARAQEIGMRIASALDSGSRAQLRGSDADFTVLFELDSRGREPALLWLENRVLYALLGDEPVSGIESAMQRARAVGVEESLLVFGHLASALAAGDLPGAGATIARWDARAKDDALYQLLAGVVFERAGNPEALDRYVAATRLQPDLKLAHAFAARLALLQQGPSAAKNVVEVARSRLGPGLASDVISGLEWATAPFTDAPGPALPPLDALGDLSPMMQETASAVMAVKAQREGRTLDSKAAFERAIGPASTPALAAWVGYQALDAGDVETARRAALKAVQLSVLHKNSQALAARIALAEGRLGAAREAVSGVDPSSRDAILIEAISAYENLQGPQAARLIASLPPDPAVLPTLEALVGSDRVISGAVRPKDERLVQLSNEQKLWGSIVAVDLALDSGRLAVAESIATMRAWDPKVPAYAARLIRLRRYQGQGAAALELASMLSDPKLATPRSVTEVVLAFIDGGRPTAAENARSTLNAAAGGLGPWLEAIVEVANGRQPNAAKRIASLPLPEKSRPALEQLVALRALAAIKDRRGRAYYVKLEPRFKGQPDLITSGKQLGIIKN